ncbi:MAG: CWC16 protein, partial [Benniella sp.]
MADRKAINKYYPPDWDPSKGSINTYVGQHPLRDRARKLDQGILIVRFELPYNIWCNGCNNPIGMGVRYNAEKKKIGNYYSTPILSFRMKCHLCDNWFEIQTDPKNAVYVVTAGARKKVEDFEAADNETLEIDTPEEFERRANDQFAKLEHLQQDALKAKSGATVLTRLQRLNERQWSDPYTLSQKLRKEFRTAKKARLKEEAECKSIADRVGFAFNVLPESQEDREGSKAIDFESSQ